MSDVTKRQTCDQFRPVLYIVRLNCEMTAWKNCDSNKPERDYGKTSEMNHYLRGVDLCR
jgi:hypothetical protein